MQIKRPVTGEQFVQQSEPRTEKEKERRFGRPDVRVPVLPIAAGELSARVEGRVHIDEIDCPGDPARAEQVLHRPRVVAVDDGVLRGMLRITDYDPRCEDCFRL